jgi:NTE family protein
MKQKVSLVLSSGGARGIAHIGVIEELVRQDYDIVSIAGSSMGALVGGFYASGHLDTYKDWMRHLDKKDVFNLVDFTLSTNGIVKGNRIIKELKKIIPDVNIEDLPILFRAVATDLKSMKEVVFEKGSLYEAIRGSISIPTVIKPFKINGMVLIDGGVVNPLPINRVERVDQDLLMVVDVSAPTPMVKKVVPKLTAEKQSELSYFSFIRKFGGHFLPDFTGAQLNYYTLIDQASSIMVQQLSRMTIEMHPPDILISIPEVSYGGFHFYKAEEIMEAGALAMRKELEKYDGYV